VLISNERYKVYQRHVVMFPICGPFEKDARIVRHTRRLSHARTRAEPHQNERIKWTFAVTLRLFAVRSFDIIDTTLDKAGNNALITGKWLNANIVIRDTAMDPSNIYSTPFALKLILDIKHTRDNVHSFKGCDRLYDVTSNKRQPITVRAVLW
jgi:hypothetical protein